MYTVHATRGIADTDNVIIVINDDEAIFCD